MGKSKSKRIRREEAILGLSKQVTHGIYNAKLPRSVSMKDIVAPAWEGAIQAVDSFDESRGFTLKTFAKKYIKGRILDYLRSLDYMSRWYREQIKLGLLDEPTHLYINHIYRHHQHSDVTDPYSSHIFETIDNSVDVELLLKNTNLTPVERSRIKQHYLKERTLEEIGNRSGCGGMAVYHSIQSGLKKMKAKAMSKAAGA